jgi:hypothetical protein
MMTRAASIVVLALTLSCQATPDAVVQVGGWTPLAESSDYGPEDLWELINGAADAFLSYGFQGVRVQDYGAGELSVTVQVYDMGSPLNAFGIYRTEAPATDSPLSIGTEATISPPYQCLLVKDRHYVKVETLEGEIDRSTGLVLLEKIAASLPGSGELPPEFSALPRPGMKAGSARYTKQDLYGLTELENAVHASYTDDAGEQYEAFALLPTADRTLDELWTSLEAGWQKLELPERRVLYREVPYSGLVGVENANGRLIGVSNCTDSDQLRRRLDALIQAGSPDSY